MHSPNSAASSIECHSRAAAQNFEDMGLKHNDSDPEAVPVIRASMQTPALQVLCELVKALMFARHSAASAYYPGSYSAAFSITLKNAKYFTAEFHVYHCSSFMLIDISQYFLKMEDKLRYRKQSDS